MQDNSQAISFSSQQEIADRQLFLLQKQLRHLQDASPFYRDLFALSGFSAKDCQSVSDLQLLPLTSKSDLATRNLDFLADLQALSFRNADKLGGATGRIYQILNKEFSQYDNARIFHDDLVKFRKLLFSSQIFDDLSIYWEN